jgi:hypothetical protein
MRYVIDGFHPAGGAHCLSNAIKQVLHHHGCRLSEEMIFGLGAGLHFTYFEFENLPYITLSGNRRTGDFEEILACNLGITITTHRSNSREAYDTLKASVRSGIPVILFVDMNRLSYLAMPADLHFGEHAVVVFGIDETEGVAYVSDRDSEERGAGAHFMDFHLVPLPELQRAWESTCRPFPRGNRWLTFDLNGMWPVERPIIFDAIMETCTVMQRAPSGNLGLRGIRLFTESVRRWREFDEQKLKAVCFNAHFMISTVSGTGGAFRRMYGNFLKECGELLDSPPLIQSGKEYVTLSAWWEDVADTFLKIHATGAVEGLSEVSDCLEEIYQKETSFIGKLCRHVSEE